MTQRSVNSIRLIELKVLSTRLNTYISTVVMNTLERKSSSPQFDQWWPRRGLLNNNKHAVKNVAL